MLDENFRCKVPIEVQFRDLDAFGHVNNAVYFSYFETGRIVYVRELLGRPLTLADIPIVLVDAACRYRSPAVLDEQLTLGIRVTHLRRSSFACAYTLWAVENGRIIVEGRTVQASFDHRTQRVVPISAEMRERIEHYEGRTFDPQAIIPPWGR